MADRNQFGEQPLQPNPLQPDPSGASVPDDMELQWVLVPVTHADHARRRRRMMFLASGILAVLTVLAAWMYRRTVDPVRSLDEYDAGERALKIAHYQEAIVAFDRAISLKPDFADAYSLRGRAHMSLVRADLALPDFTKVIELRPRDPMGYLDRGAAHMSLEEFKDALTDFNRAVELDPKLARAYNLRGTAIRALGDPRKALEDFSQAVTLSPSMDNVFQRGSIYQQLQEHEAAIADFTQVIALDPNSAQAYYARAQSYRALGDNNAADQDHLQGRINDGR